MSRAQSEGKQILRKSRLVTGLPFFYGWIIIAVGGLGRVMTSPGQTYSVSIFVEHIIKDLGISRSLVSALFTAGTLIGSLGLPLIGRQIDRRGPRVMVGLISFGLGLACIYMGFIQGAIMLGLGFVAVRMLGQGAMGLVSRNVVNQWWVRRRGMAMGIAGVLASLVGQGGFPLLINGLIPPLGWRLSYIALGLMVLLIMLPLGLLFFRDRPEDYGLQPDGDATPALDSSLDQRPIAEQAWTLGEASHSVSFWIISAGLALIAMLGTGLTFHTVSIFEDNGLTASVAAAAFVPIAMTSAIIHLGSSVLADHMPVRFLLAIALLFMTISLVMANALHTAQLALAYGVVRGVTSGLMLTVIGVVWAQYYGRRNLGSISGLSFTLTTGASALGPMPFGLGRDLMGSYSVMLTVSAVFPLLLAVASIFARPPTRRRSGRN